MTNQEIFDRVAVHLLTQKDQSLLPDGDCAYRGVGGKTCAVGCLIPDELYDPEMEGRTVAVDMVQEALQKVGIDRQASYSLLCNLQGLHDRPSEEGWDEQLVELAKDYRLDPSVVINFPYQPTL